MDSDTVWRHIDSQRGELADLLAALTPGQWSQQSLCADWTVRDVAAHLTYAQITLRAVALPLIRAGLRSNRMIRDTARSCSLTHDEIVATIRSFQGSRRTAPFVSEIEPLIDILVHRQDICLPLEIDVEPPVDAAITSILRLGRLNDGPFRLGPRLRGIRLVATDVEWEHGDGRVVAGPLKWLLLGAAGRDVAREHLTGDLMA